MISYSILGSSANKTKSAHVLSKIFEFSWLTEFEKCLICMLPRPTWVLMPLLRAYFPRAIWHIESVIASSPITLTMAEAC